MAEESEGYDQKELRKRYAAALKRIQEEQQRKELLKQALDAGAYIRMMNIKASNEQLYTQLANAVISVVQQNRVAGKISEQQLIALLQRLTYRPETKINFKHK
ncbi:MAG: DNA-binding protein [Candidatus Micrarchaeaceae archaeon]